MKISDIQIGAVLNLMPWCFLEQSKKHRDKPQFFPGTVVYINREHRYFTAEFAFPRGSFRESFKF